MKFSAQENLVPGDGLRKKAQLLEEIGYDGIEIWGREEVGSNINQIKDELSTTKIRVSTICGGHPGDLLSPDIKEREKALEGVIKRLNWANDLGAVGVIMVPTFGSPKVPNLAPLFKSQVELEEKLLVEELKIIAKEAENLDSVVLLEPLNRYETHFIKTLDHARKILEEVASEKVKMMADFFHMSIEEASIKDSVLRNLDYIYHFHLADSNRFAPGRGHTDFSVLKTIKERGYKYYLALECSMGDNPGEELGFTLNYLKRFVD
ncbi:MAG: sugar phosphate isomerase/epimerase [Thermoproteota archaeon]|nr:sugar phosphate isomerase/epimerase [Candidatus Brockarchaeota archaeon]